MYIKCGYKITEDPTFLNERNNIPPELSIQMEELHAGVFDKENSKNTIEKLNRLILEYREVPVLKNYLATTYETAGDEEKAREMHFRIFKEHPDYLYGKIGVAQLYLQDEEYDKVKEILGENLDLRQLYPDRDVFVLNEVSTFLSFVILYYDTINNQNKKKKHLDILKKIDPVVANSINIQLTSFKLSKNLSKWRKMNMAEIKPDVPEIELPKSENNIPPQFNHPEIENLYIYGSRIPMEILREIISLPRKTLIQDLETVLNDAVDRFNYFYNLDYNDTTHTFPVHAVYILTEIKAEESLQGLLSLFTNNRELLDYWFADLLTETMWQSFFVLGKNNTQTLKDFILRSDLDVITRCPAAEALTQIALYFPERKNEIVALYNEIFDYYLQAEKNVIDSEFIAILIGEAVDALFTELLPVIKQLYDLNYVSLLVEGDYNDVVKRIEKGTVRKRDIKSLDAHYQSLVSWLDHNEQEQKMYEQREEIKTLQQDKPSKSSLPQMKPNKIGRNDPCPCGSGKKYKKCCMDNDY